MSKDIQEHSRTNTGWLQRTGKYVRCFNE